MKIPKVPELLTYDEQFGLAEQLSELDVTLDNLDFAYEYAKWYVTQTVSERV
jgi:hypothetical protein